MASSNSGVSNFGISDGLFLVFLHLKLSGAIDWSWWLVILPLIVAGVLAIIMALALEAAK